MSYLLYEEPSITVILSLIAFIILLNGIRYVLDRLVYCGLLGEIFLGAIWGLPVGGTALLNRETQYAIQCFGYLGLIGLVFEGGLSTSPAQLRKSIFLSMSVATVGVCIPVALSFLLLFLPFETNASTVYPSPMAVFSAGASLCSTSLGTTFAILSSANIQKTQTGLILVGAAMMDDIVGLVMVNIITTLSDGTLGPWPVARPIVSSLGLLLVAFGINFFILKPTCQRLSTKITETNIENISNRHRNGDAAWRLQLLILICNTPHLGFILSILVLLAFITIASFIDASVLLAAFLAGSFLSYTWSCTFPEANGSGAVIMFDRYYKALLEQLFTPFFFASIGFSIPLTSMFRGSIIWKGIVYAILMTMAKLAVVLVVYGKFFIQQWKRKIKSTSGGQPRVDMAISRVPHIQALMIGAAMVARGEVGFLIASLSESSNTLTSRPENLSIESSTSEDIFLVIVWAIVLCTIAGPILVGILVRKQFRDNQLIEEAEQRHV